MGNKTNKRKILVLSGSILPILSSCLYSFGSQYQQGAPEGYVFYYGLESMLSDGSQNKMLLDSVISPSGKVVSLEEDERLGRRPLITAKKSEGEIYGYAYNESIGVLFSYSYLTGEVTSLAEVGPSEDVWRYSLRARFLSFDSHIFLCFNTFSYWLNENEAQRMDGRILYSNDSGYFYCKTEGENCDTVITYYSYSDGSTSRSSFSYKDFGTNSSFIYSDSPDGAFFCQKDHKTLQSFDVNAKEWTEKEMANKDTPGEMGVGILRVDSSMKESATTEHPDLQKDVRSPYYLFREDNETYLGSWFDESWSRKIPFISSVADAQHVSELGKIWFYGGLDNDIGVTYSIEDDAFAKEKMPGMNSKSKFYFSYPVFETDDYSFEVRMCRDKTIDLNTLYDLKFLLIRTNKKNGDVYKMQEKRTGLNWMDYSFFPDYVDTSKSL